MRLFGALRHDFRKHKSLLLMLIIPMSLLVLFQYIPLYGLQIAFRDYVPIQGIGHGEWVGLKHILRFLQYKGLGQLLRNTLVLNLYGLLLTPLPMVFALCVHYLPFPRFRRILQVTAMLPHFFSIVVVCSLVTRFLGVNGELNGFLGLFGIESTNFLAKGELFPSIYAWSGAWQGCGYSAIVYISVLSEVSREQREAAVLDGADLLRRIIYLDIPNMLPLYGVNLVFQCGSLLSNYYEKILLLQNNMNLPYSQVISTYTYEIAFNSFIPQYSLAMAAGLVTSAVNLTLLLAMKRLVRPWEDMNV